MTTFLPLKAMQETKTKTKRILKVSSLSFIATGVAQQKASYDTTKGILNLEEDFQVIQLTAINASMIQAMSNQCTTTYNLAAILWC